MPVEGFSVIMVDRAWEQSNILTEGRSWAAHISGKSNSKLSALMEIPSQYKATIELDILSVLMSMVVAERHKPLVDVKLFRLCPTWQLRNTLSSSSSTHNLHHSGHDHSERNSTTSNNIQLPSSSKTMSSMAKSLSPPRCRL